MQLSFVTKKIFLSAVTFTPFGIVESFVTTSAIEKRNVTDDLPGSLRVQFRTFPISSNASAVA